MKSRLGTIEAFVADAFRGDMGMTSPQRPDEPANPDHLTDDAFPGVDLPATTVEDVAFYIRTLAMPSRTGLTAQGSTLFAQAGCANCHSPAQQARADYEIPSIAGQPSEIYSDLLLHDMGTSATEREWRTTPLMGLRHSTSFLHDGRATTIDEAITMHRGTGSEANFSVDRFEALSQADRDLLIDFVSRL